jgi:hypothetical protein
MMFFMLVFMLAIGSLAYESGLQAQSSNAQENAVQMKALRGSESLTFSLTQRGVTATNEGPYSAAVEYAVLKFPNGTVYPLATSAALTSGASVQLISLIPSGLCSPGTSTCVSRYEQIVDGNPPGSSVGLVTSMGNAFWYTYGVSLVPWISLTSFPRQCPTGQAVSTLNRTVTCVPVGGVSSWAKNPASTGSAGVYSSTGLSVALAPNRSYAFFVFTAIEPTVGIEKYNFEVHALPTGATLIIACSPLSYPIGGGNQPTNCVRATGTPIASLNTLGFGTGPPVYSTPGLFGVVTIGAIGGTLEVDFACLSDCGGVTLEPGSFMMVQPLA